MGITEQEPTTKNDLGVDCISRQAVLEQAYAYGNGLEPDGYCVNVEDIQALPSVTPQEPKRGQWISRWYAGHNLHFHVCSECNEEFSCDMETGISINNYRYCPNCGAKMESED